MKQSWLIARTRYLPSSLGLPGQLTNKDEFERPAHRTYDGRMIGHQSFMGPASGVPRLFTQEIILTLCPPHGFSNIKPDCTILADSATRRSTKNWEQPRTGSSLEG